MSADIDRVLIYQKKTAPTVLDGETLVGEHTVNVYVEDDGKMMVVSKYGKSDLDPAKCDTVVLDEKAVDAVRKHLLK